jgi:type II secretory pathway pseudopilin PulG
MGRRLPSGECCGGPTAVAPRNQRGFTYIAILLAVAFLGIGLAAIGSVWATTAQREREAQLLFVGDAYRHALGSYYRTGQRYPQELNELIEDTRSGVVRRHLRRIYADPMTGQADWELIRNPDGGIAGVVSTSIRVPIKRANFAKDDASFVDAQCYCDWRFQYTPPARGRVITPRPARSPQSAPSSSPTS